MPSIRANAGARRSLLLLLAAVAAACSPVLDWREVRPPGSGATLLLPCRPDTQTRAVQLAGQAVRLTLQACNAGDVTWALAFADIGDGMSVAVALDALRQSAAANIGADPARANALAVTVAGAANDPPASRVLLAGRLPDGRAVQAQVAVFAIGTRVLQATAIGARLPPDGIEMFFSNLRPVR